MASGHHCQVNRPPKPQGQRGPACRDPPPLAVLLLREEKCRRCSFPPRCCGNVGSGMALGSRVSPPAAAQPRRHATLGRCPVFPRERHSGQRSPGRDDANPRARVSSEGGGSSADAQRPHLVSSRAATSPRRVPVWWWRNPTRPGPGTEEHLLPFVVACKSPPGAAAAHCTQPSRGEAQAGMGTAGGAGSTRQKRWRSSRSTKEQSRNDARLFVSSRQSRLLGGMRGKDALAEGSWAGSPACAPACPMPAEKGLEQPQSHPGLQQLQSTVELRLVLLHSPWELPPSQCRHWSHPSPGCAGRGGPCPPRTRAMCRWHQTATANWINSGYPKASACKHMDYPA